MKLVDMSASGDASVAASAPQPYYPYGLTIELNEDALVKLGIKGLPKPGADMVLQANVCVCNVSASEGEEKPRRTVILQIKEMGLSGNKKAAEVLFGGTE